MIIENPEKILKLNNDNLIYDCFDEKLINFFKEISNFIFSDKNCRQFPDLVAFAYWARPENLNNLKVKNQTQKLTKGRGLVFHVTPSNVPTNFIYSLAFGLISGNSNIIKLPSKKFIQIDLLISIISKILKNRKFISIKKRIKFIRFDSEKKFISEYLSLISNARMIWGSDATVDFFKSLKTQVNCKDLLFYDKYSFSVIDSKKLIIEKKEIGKLVKKFYTDTLLFDQNACTSPHIIFWYGNNKDNDAAKKLFWEYFSKYMRLNYESSSHKNLFKYSNFIFDTMNLDYIDKIQVIDDHLYVVNLKKIKNEMTNLRGRFGYFYQKNLSQLSQLIELLNHKVQSMLYFGLSTKDINQLLMLKNKSGIDRIAPIGKSLYIDFSWDGYNIFDELTTSVEIIE